MSNGIHNFAYDLGGYTIYERKSDVIFSNTHSPISSAYIYDMNHL